VHRAVEKDGPRRHSIDAISGVSDEFGVKSCLWCQRRRQSCAPRDPRGPT
jgi:hypothetical protein